MKLSKRLGLSLGRVNYVIRALIEMGFIKAKRFKNSKNKMAYMYTLTPHGISSEIDITREFLKRRISEYNAIKTEIEELERELEDNT